MTQVSCEHCKIFFEKEPSQLDHYPRSYCSRNCFHASRSGRKNPRKIKLQKEEFSYELLVQRFEYSHESGLFKVKEVPPNSFNKKVGDIAGHVSDQGYVKIVICGKCYAAHRLAWLYVNKKWPDGDIDHINGVRSDNRIGNLRDVTRTINVQNRRDTRPKTKTSRLGVTEVRGKYQARITVDGRQISLGVFEDKEVAHMKYIEAKRLLHKGNTL